MSFAAERWPQPPGTTTAPALGNGAAVVWRVELAKIARLARVQAVLGVCLVGPLLFALAIRLQSALPQDTLFGQWLPESGLALPMVLLSFAGQWILPLLAAIVAGDVFSSEDHLGTWKTVLTRSRTRGQIFAGKTLTALSFSLGTLVLLTLSGLLAGLTLGLHPVVGLSGQLVPTGHGTVLVLASWATQLPPMLGYTALAVLLSVASRNSVVGMGGPVLLGLAMQLSALVSLPLGVRAVLLSTPFAAWHGLWTAEPYTGPVWSGLLTSTCWFVVCGVAAWLLFRRRSMAIS